MGGGEAAGLFSQVGHNRAGGADLPATVFLIFHPGTDPRPDLDQPGSNSVMHLRAFSRCFVDVHS